MTLLHSLMLLGIMTIPVLLIVMNNARAFGLLQTWADENGCVLVKQERRGLRKGPFFWTASRDETVYRITIQDSEGHTRTGWARCGSWMLSPRTDTVEVRWDNQDAAA